jgi:hypothetical protein
VTDPFAGLDPEWAKSAERRAVRANRVQRLRRGFRRPRGPGKRGRWLLIGVFAAVAVALSFGASWVLPDGSSRPSRYDYARETPPPGRSVTTPARTAAGGPFAGTPAAAYPKGEAGIEVPPATAVDGFTIEQVRAALANVRAALVAGRLDRRMLVGHDPAVLTALFDPEPRAAVATMFQGPVNTAAGLATWVDPAARLDPAEAPRVSGSITYAAGAGPGRPVLRVTTNFVWVYAFAGPDLATPYAAVHDNVQWDFPAGRGMWATSIKSYYTAVDCGAWSRGLLAPGRIGATTARGGAKTDYLRADHAMEIPNDCPGA